MSESLAQPGARGRLLVMRFAVLSALAFLGVGLLLHERLADQVLEEHRQAAQFHAVFTSEHVLGPELTPSDLAEPVTGARYAALRAFVAERVLVAPATRLNVWHPDGTVLFSDDRSLVGRSFPERVPDLGSALQSGPHSDVSDLLVAENAGDRGVARTMFRTYLPLRMGDGRPDVVVEVYQDYAPTRAAASRFLRTLDATLVVGLLVLYALLLPIAHRTGRFLRRQSARLREQAEQVGLSERRFRALVHGSSDLITVIDPDTTIRYQSPAIERVLGLPVDQLLDARLVDLVHPDDRQLLLRALTGDIAAPGGSGTIEVRWHHVDGSWRTVESRLSNLQDEPSVQGVTLNSRDVTDRRALEEQLSHRAFHDNLTDLANRALFADRLEHALRRANRTGCSLAVLFLDLDGFKSVNDGWGHPAGDAALVAVADRLLTCVRDADTVARMGGDEFAVLIEDLDNPDDAAGMAERIVAAMDEPLALGDGQVRLGASVGIAHAAPATTSEDLLRNADVAMYQAKSEGKGRFMVFTPAMHAALAERLQLTTDLRRAVQHHEFLLHYQPIMSLDTGDVVGVEALVRWAHPDRGLLGPAAFIPLAEETGLILDLGRWVLDEACQRARRWQLAHQLHEHFEIAVNLSARQLRPSLPDEVASALQASGLHPRHLVLEITESVLMDDLDAAVAILSALRTLGVSTAIDDFGTGYSSLSHLQHLPVDTLKIDKSFVDELHTDREGPGLAQAIVQMAQTLHLRTIAEGIEHEQQAQQLRAMACEHGQGFLFARPVDAHAITALLASPTPRQPGMISSSPRPSRPASVL